MSWGKFTRRLGAGVHVLRNDCLPPGRNAATRDVLGACFAFGDFGDFGRSASRSVAKPDPMSSSVRFDWLAMLYMRKRKEKDASKSNGDVIFCNIFLVISFFFFLRLALALDGEDPCWRLTWEARRTSYSSSTSRE